MRVMPSGSIYARHLAAQQFHRARRQAAIERLVARLSGESIDLLSFNDIIDKLGVRSQSTAGLQQIPLSAIVGSVGRYQDFTRAFPPPCNPHRTALPGTRRAPGFAVR